MMTKIEGPASYVWQIVAQEMISRKIEGFSDNFLPPPPPHSQVWDPHLITDALAMLIAPSTAIPHDKNSRRRRRKF